MSDCCLSKMEDRRCGVRRLVITHTMPSTNSPPSPIQHRPLQPPHYVPVTATSTQANQSIDQIKSEPKSTMTSRNLNTTWRDTIFTQYAADLEADVPFPVRYLINAPPWRDIFITVPEKIDLRAYKSAVLAFYTDRRCSEETYEVGCISVRPRKLVGGDDGGMIGRGDGQDLTERD